ncbi:low-density lipoprotein receptor-related protein [Teleopsis dalmanni]|uniref:low-density lipoprotein receptor-related protein n=1 Tax=Teleopsis dalmanni TaxID=139649 RepID=UPI0018CFC978|nr:low-density lipoprotein receptor-related protein [Teleopsis dalmanni]
MINMRVSNLLTKLLCTVGLLAVAFADNPCAKIKNGQFICVDCETLAVCLHEDDQWHTMTVQQCDGDRQLYCDEEARHCTRQKTCGVPTTSFQCQNPGLYPDPYNCKYYHECNTSNEHIRHVCPNNYGYSVTAKSCVVRSNQQDCKNIQFKCEHSGDMGAWPEDPNIYYICVTKHLKNTKLTYPLLYRCDDGYIFTNGKCVISESKVTTPTQAEKTTVNTSCIANQLIANPTNCHGYYSCKNGELKPYDCPNGSYFDSTKLTCVKGNC